MAKKENQQTPEKRKIPWWVWVIIAILILIAQSDSSDNEEYKSCVESCVDDLDGCSLDVDFYGNFVSCEECSIDLESCINWCD
jgi:hypothetical protein